MPVPWIPYGIAGEHVVQVTTLGWLGDFSLGEGWARHDNLGQNEFLLDKLWSG